jgi:hypothetical protein
MCVRHRRSRARLESGRECNYAHLTIRFEEAALTACSRREKVSKIWIRYADVKLPSVAPSDSPLGRGAMTTDVLQQNTSQTRCLSTVNHA